MIPIKNYKRKNRLSKTTLTSLRNLAKKGSDADIEAFVYKVAMEYIAAVRNTDYIEEEDYLKVKDTVFETVCPYCGETLSLDLMGVTKQ